LLKQIQPVITDVRRGWYLLRSNLLRADLNHTRSLDLPTDVYQQRVQQLDCDRLIRYVTERYPGLRGQIATTIEHYFCFLYLLNCYPQAGLVPTQAIDRVWHCHILDTRRYRRDCLALFGYVIDHEPMLKLEAMAQPEQLMAALAITSELLQRHFAIDLGVTANGRDLWAEQIGESVIDQPGDRLGGNRERMVDPGACSRPRTRLHFTRSLQG